MLQDCLSSCLSRRSTGVLESQWGSPERQGALDAVLQGNPRGPPLPRPIILAVLLLPLGRALLGRKASGPRPSQSTHARSRENPESSPSSLLGNSEHPGHVPAPGFSGGREKCGKQLFPPVPTPSTGALCSQLCLKRDVGGGAAVALLSLGPTLIKPGICWAWQSLERLSGDRAKRESQLCPPACCHETP